MGCPECNTDIRLSQADLSHFGMIPVLADMETMKIMMSPNLREVINDRCERFYMLFVWYWPCAMTRRCIFYQLRLRGGDSTRETLKKMETLKGLGKDVDGFER
jgi:hypothetical protein